MTWEEKKKEFIDEIETYLDPQTVYSYKKRLKLFEEFWLSQKGSNLPDPKKVNEEDMRRFVRWMKSKNYSKNYISRTYGDVLRFLEYSENTRVYRMKMRKPKRKKPAREYMKEEAIEKLLNVFSEDDIISFQNKVYLYIINYTGMRAAEAAQLLWTDIDFKERIIHIRPEVGKMGNPRTVSIEDEELLDILKRYKEKYDLYMEYRRKMGKNILNSLFFKVKKGDVIVPVDKRARTLYNRIYKRLGAIDPELQKDFGLHKMRRSYIRRCVRAGMRVEALATQTGHTVDVLLKYYAQYDIDFFRREYEKVKRKKKEQGEEHISANLEAGEANA